MTAVNIQNYATTSRWVSLLALLVGCGSAVGGSGGSPAITAGSACSSEGKTSCGLSAGASAVLKCNGGVWELQEPCKLAGLLCKSIGGSPACAIAAGGSDATVGTDVLVEPEVKTSGAGQCEACAGDYACVVGLACDKPAFVCKTPGQIQTGGIVCDIDCKFRKVPCLGCKAEAGKCVCAVAKPLPDQCACESPAYAWPLCEKCKNSHFALPSCTEECAPNFYNWPSCDKCADFKKTGSECDKCADPKKTGPNCDICAPKFTGPKCDQCADPTTFTGPKCDQCAQKNFKGAMCNECLSAKKTGQQCDQCLLPQFTGPYCDECADPKKSGATCEQCIAPKKTGTDCDKCIDSNDCLSVIGDTVYDSKAKLTWQRTVPENEYNWNDAKAYCVGLNLAGKSDWRLPEIAELESLLVPESSPTIDTTAFPNTPEKIFWTNTDSSAKAKAWVVSFYYGYSYSIDVTDTYRVRCVR